MNSFISKNIRRLVKPVYKKYTATKIEYYCNQPKAILVDFDETHPDRRDLELNPVENIRLIALRLLSVFESLSRLGNFNYSLFYGTMLGFERHGGFIPWDDDIDICLSSQDFKIFLKYINLLPNSVEVINQDIDFFKVMDKYSIISRDRKRGVALDIFIYHETPLGIVLFHPHKKKYISIQRRYMKVMEQINFEGIETKVFKHRNQILQKIYGDFMVLPPISKRVFPHLNDDVLIKSYL